MTGSKAVLEAGSDSNLMFKFAHDLRSYLRTVLTRIELLQHTSTAHLTREDQALLTEAVGAAREIGSLVTAMVTYCEPETEQGSSKLGLLIAGLLNDLASCLKDARAEVEVKVPEVQAPLALRGVLKELLINACRFRVTNRPLRISISARILSSLLEISISDDGPGVEPEFIDKIFAPFYRLHGRDEYPGHGLGLAVCRKTICGLGGTIVAVSSPGQGLTVNLTVPLPD